MKHPITIRRSILITLLIALHLTNIFFIPLPANSEIKEINPSINKNVKNQLINNLAAMTYAVTLKEGVNMIRFVVRDGTTGKEFVSDVRTITLDTIQPAFDNLSAKLNPETKKLEVYGNVIDKNLQKIEIKVDNGIPIVLGTDELIPIDPQEKDEYKFVKIFDDISETYHNLTLKAYDLAGNISETSLVINKQKDKLLLARVKNDKINLSTISNLNEHLLDSGNYQTTNQIVSGEPFNIKLFTCFHDDGGIGQNGKAIDEVETFFEIASHRVEVSYNGSDFKDITQAFDKALSESVNKCFDIQKYGIQYKKLDCTDSSLDTCMNACNKLDGHICNVEIINTKHLNNYDKSTAFSNPFPLATSNLDLSKQWLVGNYKLRFIINENPSSCSSYGTCLSKFNEISSETYTYSIDVVRKPKVQIEIPKEYKKLEFNKNNEFTFKVIAKDDLPINLKENPIPLKIEVLGLPTGDPTAKVELVSSKIDINDPRNAIFELKASFFPKKLNNIQITAAVIFPKDIFNTNGIEIKEKATLKIAANIDAEIISPVDGSIISGDIDVTSRVVKPADLNGDLSFFNNCMGGAIYYGIKLFNSNEIKPYGALDNTEKLIRLTSKAKDLNGSLTFNNQINFDLKNAKDYENSYLSGNIFGPAELYGEYSTLCNDKNVEFTGKPAIYVLLDNPQIVKAKCKYPRANDYSRCEFTIANNTLLDDNKALELEIIPNSGAIDPSCEIPKITFNKKDNLTKKVSIKCLPKDATTFKVKLKRSLSFLNEIEEKLKGTTLEGTPLTTNDKALIAQNESFEVKNSEPDEEDDKDNEIFHLGDNEEESRFVDGKIITVHDLKDVLFQSGLLKEEELGQGYTLATHNSWKLFIHLIKTCDKTSLRLQTTEPTEPIMTGCSLNVFFDENGNPISLPDPNTLPEPEAQDLKEISKWQEVLQGFAQAGINNLKDLLNPATIGIISTVVLLTTTGLAGAIAASVPAALLAFATYSVVTGGTLLNAKFIIDEINNNFSDKSTAWKISYGIGRLQPDLTLVKGLTGLVKNVKISEKVEKILKLDNGAYKETAEFIHEQQRTINKLDITEEARNVKRGQLDTSADSTYESLVNSDQTKKGQINNLYNEVNKDSIMRADLENNVIYKDYPKDLSNTPEDPLVVKEKIFKPTIEYGAKAKAVGVENKFVFKNEFDKDFGSNFNLQDLQKQGFLLGDEISKDLLPPKVWRIINYRDDLNMLGGNGPVFTFFDDGLTTKVIKDELTNNRINFLSKIGLDPNDYNGKLFLFEIDTKSEGLSSRKPTPKDSKFGGENGYFRYNNSNSFGKILDLNTGKEGFSEAVIKDEIFTKESLPNFVTSLEEI